MQKSTVTPSVPKVNQATTWIGQPAINLDSFILKSTRGLSFKKLHPEVSHLTIRSSIQKSTTEQSGASSKSQPLNNQELYPKGNHLTIWSIILKSTRGQLFQELHPKINHLTIWSIILKPTKGQSFKKLHPKVNHLTIRSFIQKSTI